MTAPDTPPQLTRRSFLSQGAFTVGGAGFLVQGNETATETETAGTRATQRMVIPAVETFEGNYEGQFVYIQSERGGVPEGLPTRDCDFPETWTTEETRVYKGQLLDRFREEPTTAEIAVYVDEGTAEFENHVHFIVQNVVDCPDGYVGLEAEWLPRSAVVGKSPGPTVEPTDTGGPGFGVLAAVASGLGAAVYRASRTSTNE